MDINVKHKWVKELRSGRFDQCIGSLRKSHCAGSSYTGIRGGYDPLGVLCQLWLEGPGKGEKYEWLPLDKTEMKEVFRSQMEFNDNEEVCPHCGMLLEDGWFDYEPTEKELKKFVEEYYHIPYDTNDCKTKIAFAHKDWEGTINFLPSKVVEWAGLLSYDPWVGPARITNLNDIYAMSFEEIADLIEEHL